MSKEAALILGGIAALVNGIVTVAGLGAFDDGLQFVDLIPILGPVLAAFGIRYEVWSQDSVDKALARSDGTVYRQGGGGKG